MRIWHDFDMAIITLVVKSVVKDRIACDPFYGASNMAALDEGLEQEKRGQVAASCTTDEFADSVVTP